MQHSDIVYHKLKGHELQNIMPASPKIKIYSFDWTFYGKQLRRKNKYSCFSQGGIDSCRWKDRLCFSFAPGCETNAQT